MYCNSPDFPGNYFWDLFVEKNFRRFVVWKYLLVISHCIFCDKISSFTQTTNENLVNCGSLIWNNNYTACICVYIYIQTHAPTTMYWLMTEQRFLWKMCEQGPCMSIPSLCRNWQGCWATYGMQTTQQCCLSIGLVMHITNILVFDLFIWIHSWGQYKKNSNLVRSLLLEQ